LEFETKKTSKSIYIKLEHGDGARRGKLNDFGQQRGRQHGG